MRLIIAVSDATAGNPNVVEGGLDRFEIKEGMFSGVEDLENELLQAVVYPNPSTGMVHVRYTVSASEKVKLKVRNVIGEEIITDEALNSTGNFQLNLSAQPQGIYFISLQTTHSEKTLKFSLLR